MVTKFKIFSGQRYDFFLKNKQAKKQSDNCNICCYLKNK